MRFRTLAAVLAAGVTIAALPTAGRAADPTVTRGVYASFDGTEIVYNLFLPGSASKDAPVPAILRTHGWGGSGESSIGSGTLKKLLDAGYAVLTWDSRGFGQSGGEANVDDPGFEVRDASGLIDLLAGRPEIAKTAPNDPIIGMTGGSYAGGIQLALAAFDRRVDAIAPEITWNDLRRALFPGSTVKLGWGQLLFGAGLATATSGGLNPSNTAGVETGAYSPGLHQTYVRANAAGYGDPETLAWYQGKGVAGYGFGHPVGVPTLLLQGKVDTLFDLNEAYANYKHVRATGAPVKMISFCGGHVGCPASYKDGSSRARLDTAILTWFDRYLKGNQQAVTGPNVEWSTNDGVWHGASDFPTAANPGEGGTTVTATGTGTLVSTPAPTGTTPVNNGTNTVTTDTPAPANDPGSMNVPILTTTAPTQIAGIPRADVTVNGVGSGANLFFKLVDREANIVIDLQAESLRVAGPLTGTAKTYSIDLVGVAYTMDAGHHLDLQVSTTGIAHGPDRGASRLDVTVKVAVPTLPGSAFTIA